MRIFVNNVDSYVGNALCADLRKALGSENRLLGTLCDDLAEGKVEVVKGMGVKRIVSRSDQNQYLKDVLSCSLIIYDLHSANPAEVENVIKHLKVAQVDHLTRFILISSVNVWANTKKEYVPLDGEGEQEQDQEEEYETNTSEPKTKPQEFTDADLDRRVPSERFHVWKYLETLALSLESKEKLVPHVIAAGILYGNGESIFNDFFKAAWLTEPNHVIIGQGNNYIPCVHVRDVARLVKYIHVRGPDAPALGKYLLAVDQARPTQAEIVQAVVNKISNGAVVPSLQAEDAKSEYKAEFTLDLIMAPSAPMTFPDFPWWCRSGLIANMDKVAAEFCKWRNLRPIKMVMVGPPGSGAERLCSEIAGKYLHKNPPHFTFESILKDAMAPGIPGAKRLAKKVQKLNRTPGKKLPLKLRTKLVRKKLQSNVCCYRGYVLEGYPATYEEANALFMERIYEEGEEPEEEEEEPPDAEEPPPVEGEEGAAEPVEEEEEVEEEEPPQPELEDEDGEEIEGAPKFKLNDSLAPKFVVSLQSDPRICKERIFSGVAEGPESEELFELRTNEYHKTNSARDGSPGVREFFSEIARVRVLEIDADTTSEIDAFQALRAYLECNGQYFNYLTSEEEICKQREDEIARKETEIDEERQGFEFGVKQNELKLRQLVEIGEGQRRKDISDAEAAHLESQVCPLRQYLLQHVVPTLTEGLSEVCKEQPEDPIEYLSYYLFSRAGGISSELG